MATEVVAPDGARWRVRRRWLGGRRLPRWRGKDAGDLWSWVDAGTPFDFGDSVLGAIAFVVAIVVIAAVVVFLVLPLAILLVEVLLFLVLVALGVLARVALRRPWILEARRDDGRELLWSMAGWGASREALAEIAAGLERGDPQVLPSAAVASGGRGRR